MNNIQARHIPVVILAGGRSSRMQAEGLTGDKYLHLLDDKPVIAHLIERLKMQADHIALNSNQHQSDLSRFGLPVIADQFAYNSGPLTGILTAMHFAKDQAFVVTAAADTPFIPSDLLEKLLSQQQATQSDVVFAASHGATHPTFGLWRTNLATNLSSWLAQGHKPSVISFAMTVKQTIAGFPVQSLPDGSTYDPFFNINEPADLIKARELQKQLNR